MPVSVEGEGSARLQKSARPSSRRRFDWRPIRDAAIAGLIFTIASSGLVCNHARAAATPAAFGGLAHAARLPAIEAVAEPGPRPIVQIATAASPADAIYRETSITAAWGLLGVAFSILAALDLALLRHLKRAYATPYRRFPLRK